jgi:hypothetical protein
MIATVGTAGATTVDTAIGAGATVLPVASTAGFSPGHTITIDHGANYESAVIVSTNRRDATITIAAPLTFAHAAGAQVSGTGITLSTALTRQHAREAQVAGKVPTPGAPNQYFRKNP